MAKTKLTVARTTGKTRDILAAASQSAKPPTARSKSSGGLPRNKRGKR